MLRVLRDDIILTDDHDIVNLVYALTKQVDVGFVLPVDHGLKCLERSLDAHKHLHDATSVRPAFLLLASHCSRFDADYALLCLGLKALYRWNWGGANAAHHYMVSKVLQAAASVLHLVPRSKFDGIVDIVPAAVQGMAEHCQRQHLATFVPAALSLLQNSGSPEWGTALRLWTTCNGQFVDQFCEFGRQMWILWGPSTELLLAMVDACFAGRFGPSTACTVAWLHVVFGASGDCADSVATYIVSRLNKWLNAKNVDDCALQHLLELVAALPPTGALAGFVKRLWERVDLDRVLSNPSAPVLLMSSILKDLRLGTLSCELIDKAAGLGVCSFAQLFSMQCQCADLCDSDSFCSFLESPEVSVAVKLDAVAIMDGLVSAAAPPLGHLATNRLFDRLVALLKDMCCSDKTGGVAAPAGLLAKLAVLLIRSKLRSPQDLFDALSFNHSWVKLHAKARGVPFTVVDAMSRLDPEFGHRHRSEHQSLYIIGLADYVLFGAMSEAERMRRFKEQLDGAGGGGHGAGGLDHGAGGLDHGAGGLDHGLSTATTTTTTTFTIQLLEQVVLRAVAEGGRPEWYPLHFTLVVAHLLRRHPQSVTQRTALLRAIRTFSSVDLSALAELLLAVDGPDQYELLRRFVPSAAALPGFIEHVVLSFDAREVYEVFVVLLKKPLHGKIIDMFLDWLVSISHPRTLDLAAPLYRLAGVEEFVEECGRSLFKLMMLPEAQRDVLPDHLLTALVKCFECCCRLCHPNVIVRFPPLPIPMLVGAEVDLAGTRARFPLLAESSIAGEPRSAEDVFYMLGSLLRQRPQVPASVSMAVCAVFDYLKRTP